MSGMPITGVGLGSQFVAGAASVYNTALGIFPPGQVLGDLGTAIVGPPSVATSLLFEFTQPYAASSANSVRFTFGGAQLQSNIGLGGQTQYGLATVTNAAQGIFPLSLMPPTVPMPRVYPGNYQFHALDFADPAPLWSAQNVAFHFGGVILVSAPGFASFETGYPDADVVLSAAPNGTDSQQAGVPRVSEAHLTGRDVAFNFVDPPDGSTRLDFGDSRPVTRVGLGDASLFGAPEVANAALGIFPLGLTPPTPPVPLVYRSVVRGGVVEFSFVSPKVPADAQNIGFYFNTPAGFGPSGFRSSQFGEPYLTTEAAPSYPQTVYPFGSRMTQWGDFTTTQTGLFQVLPVGAHHAAYGQPALYNSDQHLVVFNEGARYTEFGTAYVWIPPDQFVTPAGLNATEYGGTLIAWEIRWLYQTDSHNGPMVGAQTIDYRTKVVSVPWTVFTQYGSALVGRHVDVFAQGSDFSRIPNTHDVAYGNLLEAEGLEPSDTWGWPWVSRSPRVLNSVQHDESLRTGTAKVELWVRYLQHSGYPWESQGVKWGAFTHVFNANRAVTPPGLNSLRIVPYHLIENTARALLTHPVAQLTFGIDTFIAHRVRHLSYDGIDSFRLSNFGNRIHNAARVLAAQGRSGTLLGAPENVESNRRTVRHHSGPTEAIGEAFIADAVRSVAAYPNPSARHRVGAPRISLFEHFVAPDGVGAPALGSPVLLGPFRRTIAPRWIPRAFHGEARVCNKTPQLYPPGRPYTEFSEHAWISRWERALLPAGVGPLVITKPVIEYRTKTVRIFGVQTFSMSPWGTRVRKVLDDPPGLRTMAATGIEPRSDYRFGQPRVNYNLVYPAGLNSLKFGEVDTTAQAARNRTYWPYTEWGAATVTHWWQPAYPTMFPAENLDNTSYGKPRLSPYTIWARLDTPQQAQQNHPGQAFHRIDERWQSGYADSRWPWFGRTDVANRHRSIYPYHNMDSSRRDLNGRTKFGELSVINKTVVASPEGKLSMLFGYPKLIPHTKKLWGIGFRPTAFGNATVGQEREACAAEGLRSLEVGTHRIEKWIREVYPSGYSATQWGNNNPMVHYPRRFSIGNYDATVFGTTWASHRIRYVEPVGETMTQADWVSFRDRMIVRLRQRPAMQGFDAARVGHPAIANKQQFIAPYMIPPPCIPRQRAEVRHAQV